MHTLNLDTWNRRETYYFFRDYDDPFFNITAEVDTTALTAFCKTEQVSFFLASLYLSIRAANAMEPFRYRIRGEEVICHEHIHGGSTILYPDNTFGFCYFPYRESGSLFCQEGEQLLAAQRASRSFDPRNQADDLIYYSVIPWISFTAFKHARKSRRDDSIPRIVFGKKQRRGRREWMPVSVEVNHALLDGYHVGQYFSLLQAHYAQPQSHF
ncbi:MAG: chloramphenicol acetyltransferase [Lewinellaceae bacterium]|nr:chloramphenicol acetyltransferase [Lewinellaceae bacterium]